MSQSLIEQLRRGLAACGDSEGLRLLAAIEAKVVSDSATIAGLQAELDAERRLLANILDVTEEGIAIFDKDDRYAVWNRRYLEFYPELDGFLTTDRTFEAALRKGLDLATYTEGRNNEEAWLQARLERHRLQSNAEEQHLSSGRWIRVEESRMPDGASIGVRIDITEFKEKEASFRLLFEGNPVPMWLFDFETLRFLAVNNAAINHYGYSADQFMAMTTLDIRPEEDRQDALTAIRNSVDSKIGQRLFRHRKADGTLIDVEVFIRQQTHNGRQAVLVTAIDVTERMQALNELQATREFLNTVVEGVPATLFAKDPVTRKYILLNQAGEKLFGCSRETFVGNDARGIFGDRVAIAAEAIEDELIAGNAEQINASETITTPQGTRLLSINRLVVREATGRPRFILGVTIDVTERRRAEEQIAYLSHHDTLTGLPNRDAMMVRLQDGIFAASATQSQFGLLSLDLDRFKSINDVYGHAVADKILHDVARRLSLGVGDDLVFRLGGDEFVVISNEPEQPSEARRLAQRLQEALAEDFVVDGKSIKISTSMGISVFPLDGITASTLLANADAARYRVKTEARGGIRVFETRTDQALRERWILQADLGHALRKGELSLHYQPQADIDGRIFGFEALLRWQHPTRGAISPAEFVPLAEESNLILDISAWVLAEACRVAASWERPLTVAVNLSPIQFQQGELPRLIQQTLIETGLSPSRLELEITEGILLGDFAHIVGMLRRIKAMGVRIAMDDFGTGYSSLSYLQAFPFDKIKIDKSFVAAIGRTQQSTTIIRAVIGLCRGLSIPVIAEGVETEEQRAFLAQEHCPEIQGYLIGRPAPIQIYDEFVNGLDAAKSV